MTNHGVLQLLAVFTFGALMTSAQTPQRPTRNYGFFIDLVRYQLPELYSQLFGIADDTNPFAKNEQVVYSTRPRLVRIPALLPPVVRPLH